MRRIDRGYAVIYIDDTGVCLNKAINNYVTPDMISDFYRNPGSLQWNFYLIIPEEFCENLKQIKEIQKNETFTRKYVVEKNEIDSFIENLFPPVGWEHGSITLITADSWSRASIKSLELKDEPKRYGSWARDYNLTHALTEMDLLRSRLILEPNLNVVFFTNIKDEYSLAEKKFKPFMKEENDKRN